MCKYQNNQFIRLYLFIECIFLLTTTEWPIVRSLSIDRCCNKLPLGIFSPKHCHNIHLFDTNLIYPKKVHSTESTDNWTDWSAHIQCKMAFSCHVLRFFFASSFWWQNDQLPLESEFHCLSVFKHRWFHCKRVKKCALLQLDYRF